ncbi:MAG: flavodoxin family protein [Oceanococcus sp.]
MEFSQSGQLLAVMDQILQPLQDAGHSVERLRVDLQAPFPFPWPFWQFMDSFAETAALTPPPLADWSVAGEFDLVVIGYPVWFLSPPPAITAFLQSQKGKALLRGKPVISITACRNMWVQAHVDMSQLLEDAGARLLDHVALTDPSPAMYTFVTTPRWVLTGRKQAFWFFPPAGLTPQQISATDRFGQAIQAAVSQADWLGDAPMLQGLQAVSVDPGLAASEKIAKRSFRIWGKLLRAMGPPGAWQRRPVLVLYIVFLLTLICTVVPLSMLLRAIFFKLAPKTATTIQQKLEQPSGSGTHRMGNLA